jgi:hypothetical protein
MPDAAHTSGDRVRQVEMFAPEDLNRLLSENSARYLVPQLETT